MSHQQRGQAEIPGTQLSREKRRKSTSASTEKEKIQGKGGQVEGHFQAQINT